MNSGQRVFHIFSLTWRLSFPICHEVVQQSVPSARPWANEGSHWHPIRFSPWTLTQDDRRWQKQLTSPGMAKHSVADQCHLETAKICSINLLRAWGIACCIGIQSCSLDLISFFTSNRKSFGFWTWQDLWKAVLEHWSSDHVTCQLLDIHMRFIWDSHDTHWLVMFCGNVMNFLQEWNERNLRWVGRKDSGLQPFGLRHFGTNLEDCILAK